MCSVGYGLVEEHHDSCYELRSTNLRYDLRYQYHNDQSIHSR